MPLALFIDMLTRDPAHYVVIIVAVVLSVVLHELGHGITALWQGDDTPRVTGHMTWNPLVHMGGFSLMLLFLAGIAFGQMPVRPANFRSRFGRALVAFAGPLVNLLLALFTLTIVALWLRFGERPEGNVGYYGLLFLLEMGAINIVLCLFNLLPVPPLDGSTVLADLSPAYRRLKSNPNNQPLFLGVFVLVFVFAGHIWRFADRAASAYLDLWL